MSFFLSKLSIFRLYLMREGGGPRSWESPRRWAGLWGRSSRGRRRGPRRGGCPSEKASLPSDLCLCLNGTGQRSTGSGRQELGWELVEIRKKSESDLTCQKVIQEDDGK